MQQMAWCHSVPGVRAAEGPLLESSHASWHNMMLSIRKGFISVSFTHRLNAFSTLTIHCVHNFCSLRLDSKTNTNLFIFLHNFKDRSLLLTIDLSNLKIFFFGSFLSSELFFFLKGRTFWFPFGIFKLSASLLLHFGAIIK